MDDQEIAVRNLLDITYRIGTYDAVLGDVFRYFVKFSLGTLSKEEFVIEMALLEEIWRTERERY